MNIVRSFFFLILSVGIAYCVEVGPKKISIVLNQKDGPVNNEWIIETTNVKSEVYTEILKDIEDQISWNWSRLIDRNGSYILFGKIKVRDDENLMGVIYFLSKVDGKWSMSTDTGKILISR